MITSILELSTKVYKIAVEHGWHNCIHSWMHWKTMILSEVYEALDADRTDKHLNWDTVLPLLKDNPPIEFYDSHIKGTVEEELADVIIRCLDVAGLIEHIHGVVIAPREEDSNPKVNNKFTEFCYQVTETVMSSDLTQTITKVIGLCYKKLQKLGVKDPKALIELKIYYNNQRPYKHGGKLY